VCDGWQTTVELSTEALEVLNDSVKKSQQGSPPPPACKQAINDVGDAAAPWFED
jgi:hypothetical protein